MLNIMHQNESISSHLIFADPQERYHSLIDCAFIAGCAHGHIQFSEDIHTLHRVGLHRRFIQAPLSGDDFACGDRRIVNVLVILNIIFQIYIYIYIRLI